MFSSFIGHEPKLIKRAKLRMLLDEPDACTPNENKTRFKLKFTLPPEDEENTTLKQRIKKLVVNLEHNEKIAEMSTNFLGDVDSIDFNEWVDVLKEDDDDFVFVSNAI
jgi:hypothetical protein